LILLVVALASRVPEGFRLTPFGLRPKACVLEVPSGARVLEETGGVRVHHPEYPGGEFFYEAPQECHEDNAVEKYLESRKAKGQWQLGASNGWLDYGGWYPPAGENNIDSFIGNYTVPSDPASDAGQVLFYFIGMQDNAYPSVNIVQPVLTWGNGVKGWNMASWDCCPSNITVESKTITGLMAGDLIGATIQRQDSITWLIDSKLWRTGQNTTLFAQPGSELYNWADVTLEVYYVATCAEFSSGQCWFTDLVLKDVQQQVLQPTWQFTKPTTCQGQIVQTPPGGNNPIYIQHNTAAN
jgi:hypothetical protein